MKLGFATANFLRTLHEDDLILSQAFARCDVQVVPLVWTESLPAADIDAVIVRSCWDYVEDHKAFLAWASLIEERGIPVLNSAQTMRWNHDKIYLKELASLGVPTVPTLFVEPGMPVEALVEEVKSRRWHDLVVKPSIGNNALGLKRLTNWEGTYQLHAALGANDHRVLIQPFLATVLSEGEWSLMGYNRQLSHAVRKFPKPGDIRVQFTHGGSQRAWEPCAEARELASEVLKIIPEHLFARVDLLQHKGQFFVSEVEMIEPYLHFGDCETAADSFVEVALAYLQQSKKAAEYKPSVAYEAKLNQIFRKAETTSKHYLGYPINTDLDYQCLSPFLNLALNNAGDPFTESGLLNVHEQEREVIHFFGDLLNLPLEDHWGYVTSGGTEGNMFGLYAGREVHPDAVLYFSAEAHYSMAKCARVLQLRCVTVPTLANGSMDLTAFRQSLKQHRGRPAVICANVGTTMKGAIDDIPGILQILDETGIERRYIHCDAALSGAMLPFLADAPPFDFRLPIHSMAISGHKMIGSPVPCGVLLARRELVRAIGSEVEYIASHDLTLSGSRSGFAVLVLWLAIQRSGKSGLQRLVDQSMDTTRLALAAMQDIDWPAWVNPHSNTLVIRRPPADVAQKWRLACERDIAHVILMPGVTEAMVRELVQDLREVLEQVELRSMA